MKTCIMHFWPTVLGTEDWPYSDSRRWRIVWSLEPLAFLKGILHRIQRTPMTVGIVAHGADIDITARHDSQAEPLPFITLCNISGFGIADLNGAKAELLKAKWTPPKWVAKERAAA